MAVAAENMMFSSLSAEEARAVDAAVQKCAASMDSLVREIGVVYLRGMCDMLRLQGKISKETTAILIARAKCISRQT